MVDIMLYFGSFNPVHTGHTAIAEYLLDGEFTHEFWFVLSPQNPFKEKTQLLDTNDRLAMLRLATESFGERVKVSDIELSMPQPSYTIDTVRRIKQIYPDKTLGLLIGGDNLPTMHLWKQIDSLVELCDLFVYPRGSELLASDNYSFTGLYDAPLFNVSSTQIRERLFSGEDVSTLLDSRVLDYVNTNLKNQHD